jgi:2-dehydro-3-deoxyphosphogluconate aldolase/(4S)-4-hydroxy-2-oxoglutarate aldolase
LDHTTSILSRLRCIPMAKAFRPEQAPSLAAALRESGLKVINVSQQMQEGNLLVRALAKDYPDILVGAGNVQTLEEAKKAIEDGASFIFSPVFDKEMIKYCRSHKTSIFPVTTDGEKCRKLNLDVVGFYPVDKLGGFPVIDKLGEDFKLKFIVAGHITEPDMDTFLGNPHVLAMTGSWMFDKGAIAEDNWKEITESLKRARKWVIK